MRLRISSHPSAGLVAAAVVTGVGLAMSPLCHRRASGRACHATGRLDLSHAPRCAPVPPGALPDMRHDARTKTPAAESKLTARPTRVALKRPTRHGLEWWRRRKRTCRPRAPIEIDSGGSNCSACGWRRPNRRCSAAPSGPGIVRFESPGGPTSRSGSRDTSATSMSIARGRAVRRGQPLFTVYSPDLAPRWRNIDWRCSRETSLDASRPRPRRNRRNGWSRRAAAIGPLASDRRSDRCGCGLWRSPTVFRSPVSGIVMEKSIVKRHARHAGRRAVPHRRLVRPVGGGQRVCARPRHRAHRPARRDDIRRREPGETFNGRVSLRRAQSRRPVADRDRAV